MAHNFRGFRTQLPSFIVSGPEVRQHIPSGSIQKSIMAHFLESGIREREKKRERDRKAERHREREKWREDKRGMKEGERMNTGKGKRTRHILQRHPPADLHPLPSPPNTAIASEKCIKL